MINTKLFDLAMSFLDDPTETDKSVAMAMCPPHVCSAAGYLAIFDLVEIHTEIALRRNSTLLTLPPLKEKIACRLRYKFVQAVESYVERPLIGIDLDITISEADLGIHSPLDVATALIQRSGSATEGGAVSSGGMGLVR